MADGSENVELVRSLIRPFESLNVAAIDWSAPEIREVFSAGCSPDIELLTLDSGAGAGLDAEYHGVDGFARYLTDWLEPFTDYRVEWLDFIDAGDWVLVPSKQWGIGEGSGVRVELDLVWVCRVKDRLVTHVRQFDTLDEARTAIGPDD